MNRFAVVFCSMLAVGLTDAPTPEEKSTYLAAAARAGRDALAHIRLASWCEIHGMQVERHKHLGIALELAPDHPAVHGMLGEVADNGEWRMPQAVAEDHRNDPDAKSLLASYRARRERSPDTAQAHWQLADWCQENGLKGEAEAHLAAVIRLNPSREDAWKKLGYHKPKGRWTTTLMAAAEHDEIERQRKADGHWRPLLEKSRSGLARKSKRAEAEAALSKLQDARAVPSIWKVFALGGPADQERAVRLLSKIDAPSASRALASLAVMGSTGDVRAHAADGLLRRDPREFAGVLISVIRDPIEFDVREVDGPGKPGELYVHGQRMNRRFFYEAPPPLATIRPNDIVGYDSNGLPVANRVVGYAFEPTGAAVNPLMQGAPDLSNAPQVMGQLLGPAGTALGKRMYQNQLDAINAGNMVGGAGLGTGGNAWVFMIPLTFPIPVGQLKMQADQKAAMSQAQLLEDVAALERYNGDVNAVNDRAKEALVTAVLHDYGPKRKDWTKWFSALLETSTSVAARPPEAARAGENPKNAVARRAMLPGFAAGTPVWTISGLNEVESLRTGDRALTQDPDTGALSYRPVLAIHFTENQPMKMIALGNVSIATTYLERFWLAGKGWVMAGDLKPGDLVRSMSGLRRVTKIEDAKPQAVYHVQVGDGLGVLVGQFGTVVHDEQVGRPVDHPFDSAAIEGSQSAQ